MKQRALVISTKDNLARIKVDRVTMCDGCHKDGCSGECSLYKIFGAKSEFEADAVNNVGAVAGDFVTVETSDKNVNFSALIVFLLPVLIAAALYAATFFLSSEALRALIAFSSFVVYFAVLALVEHFRRNAPVRISIVEVLDGKSNS